MTDHLLSVPFVASAFFAAGFIQGTLGFGFQAMAAGLLMLLPGLDIPTNLLVPAIIANVWQLTAGPSFSKLLRRFGTLIGGILLGGITIRLLEVNWSGNWQATSGLTILATSVAAFMSGERKLPRQGERWLSPIVGVSSGVIGGMTGIAYPALLYLMMLQVSRRELVAASGCFFIVLLSVETHCWENTIGGIHISLNSMWQVIPVMLGCYLGQCVRRECDDRAFSLLYKCGLLFLGANAISI